MFVGNCLGEGKPKKAKTYANLITAYTFVVCLICASLLVLYQEWIALLFTNQPDLLQLVTSNYKYVAIFLVIHGIGMSLGGSLRGMGKQSIATKLVFAGFFLVGHPISLVLCFYFDMGMMGITYGFMAGSFTMGLLFYIVINFFSNWE